MGWTITDLSRAHMTLQQAKDKHVADAVRYGTGKTELVKHEWHPTTWYAIIRRTLPNGEVATFLRVDMIEQTALHFGYKDMSEGMGPYVQDAPSAAMKAAIFKHIPIAKGWAKQFRDRVGIPYVEAEIQKETA